MEKFPDFHRHEATLSNGQEHGQESRNGTIEVLDGKHFSFARLPSGVRIESLQGRELVRKLSVRDGLKVLHCDGIFSKSTFKSHFPERSMLIDGAGEGETWIEDKWANINDHSRWEESCTSKQMFDLQEQEALSGFYDQQGKINAIAVHNHQDPDNNLTLFLASFFKDLKQHPGKFEELKKLISLENLMDKHLGAFNLPDHIASRLKWVFHPLMNLRRQKKWSLELAKDAEIRDAMEECFVRIDAYTEGTADSEPLKKEYDVLYRGETPSWTIFKAKGEKGEEGVDARLGLAQNAKGLGLGGACEYLGMKGENHLYTFINLAPQFFDMRRLAQNLNAQEANGSTPVWGGGEKTCACHIVGTKRDPESLGRSVDRSFPFKMTPVGVKSNQQHGAIRRVFSYG